MNKFNSIADAIECGAALTERATGHLQNEAGGTCAIGAAMVAVGIAPRKHLVRLLLNRFPQEISSVCPICERRIRDYGPYQKLSILVHLNDNHEASREAIASWIRTQLSSSSSTPPATTPTYASTRLGQIKASRQSESPRSNALSTHVQKGQETLA